MARPNRAPIARTTEKTAMSNIYEDRQEARRRRYLQKAEAAQREADTRGLATETLISMGGEPIKIGHHSERRHRRL
ncbi:conjugal transfer protein TraC, partial [Enterococcus hirae]